MYQLSRGAFVMPHHSVQAVQHCWPQTAVCLRLLTPIQVPIGISAALCRLMSDGGVSVTTTAAHLPAALIM